MKKILFAFFALVAATLGLLNTSFFTYNAASAEKYVCTRGKWYTGLTRWCDDLPANPDFTTGKTAIMEYIITLVVNIYGMITDIASYVAVLLVMYGGFLYITSSGDPGKAVKGRKTIINSVIGIAIVKGGDVILSFIRTIATKASRQSLGGGSGISKLMGYVAGRAVFWGGIVAVLMIIWGALQYTASAGDPGKATKAKKTIVQASIGLALMIFAAVIIMTVINTLNINIGV